MEPLTEPLQPAAWHGDQLESVACDACGGSAFAPLIVRPDGLPVVTCRQCGLTAVNPRPRPELLAGLYDEHYFRSDLQAPAIGYADYLSERIRRALQLEALRYLSLMRRHVPLEGNSLLEVGCATGEFCAMAHGLACRTVGLDVSEAAVATARQRYPHLDYQACTLEDLDGDDRFGVIAAFGVFEHFLSPIAFLRTARRRIADDGWLVLMTPNLACGRRIGPERWIGFQTSMEHLYYVGPDELAGLGLRSGWQLVDWYTAGSGEPSAPPHAIVSGLKEAVKAVPGVHALRRMFLASGLQGHGYRRHGDGSILVAFLRPAATGR